MRRVLCGVADIRYTVVGVVTNPIGTVGQLLPILVEAWSRECCTPIVGQVPNPYVPDAGFSRGFAASLLGEWRFIFKLWPEGIGYHVVDTRVVCQRQKKFYMVTYNNKIILLKISAQIIENIQDNIIDKTFVVLV